jgi:hypothetical protein
MTYPRQEGYVPPYDGPAPMDVNSGPTNLDEAIKRGLMKETYEFIESNPEQINIPGFNGQTPLHLVCFRGADNLAQKLIDAGADVNAVTKFNETAISIAAQAGAVPLFAVLVNAGANTKLIDNNGKSLSHYATKTSFIGLFHYMLEKNLFDFDARDKTGNTALHDAIEKNRLDMALEIIKLRPVLAKDANNYGYNAMHMCALKSSKDHTIFAWKMLEICGNKILDVEDLEGNTPIQLAEKRFQGKKCCDKEQGQCEDTAKSDFAKTFIAYQKNTAYPFVGKSFQSELLWALPKLFFTGFCISQLIDYFGYFGPYSRLVFAALFIFTLMKIMKGQGHRVPHPCGLPNTVFKGFFLASSSLCFISFVVNIYPKLDLVFILWSLSLQFPFLLSIKAVLAVDANEVKRSDNFEGIEAVASKKYKPFRYVGEMKMILPPQTKYCKITKKAIKGFDHHCLFLMKSIGHGSHHIFLVFMMLQVVNQAWYLRVSRVKIKFYSFIVKMKKYIEFYMCVKFEPISTRLKG